MTIMQPVNFQNNIYRHALLQILFPDTNEKGADSHELMTFCTLPNILNFRYIKKTRL